MGFISKFPFNRKSEVSRGRLFLSLCDRIGYNTITTSDIEFLKLRDIPCPMEDDPENFKQGKVYYVINTPAFILYSR